MPDHRKRRQFKQTDAFTRGMVIGLKRAVIVAVYACGVDVEKGPIRQQLWNAPPCDNVESCPESQHGDEDRVPSPNTATLTESRVPTRRRGQSPESQHGDADRVPSPNTATLTESRVPTRRRGQSPESQHGDADRSPESQHGDEDRVPSPNTATLTESRVPTRRRGQSPESQHGDEDRVPSPNTAARTESRVPTRMIGRRNQLQTAEASQELLWLLDLLKDLELEQKAPIYFHQDNQSCLKICSSEKVSSRTKHIATKIHHLKDLQKKTVIKMIYCPTGDMKADILTKPLPRPTFEKLRYNLVMSPHSCRGFVG
ncbi:hypothetical protein LAZ67_1005168 [Cordylochernes scorpioides]|uniref:Uncharacterized protein n=1 Tax=Cordylochernes scorpioides TaxID=51811 RepID=A0ABY6JY11_9ARAC|nr:hypothetical protein LAZ67_1005168 [Cordylochernes scorpioides]